MIGILSNLQLATHQWIQSSSYAMGDCKQLCFDQLNAHILERQQNSKRYKMWAFSWSKHGLLQTANFLLANLRFCKYQLILSPDFKNSCIIKSSLKKDIKRCQYIFCSSSGSGDVRENGSLKNRGVFFLLFTVCKMMKVVDKHREEFERMKAWGKSDIVYRIEKPLKNVSYSRVNEQ